ncbi:MAG: UDP-N-acetylmuramoyl-L-alanine--D-glutamate ligase [Alphaproteobacteria bacterium]|nr:UDP-N-acetylmuramoyl-L-alanine--D-glutamate ligase [Alphaproteobacteria bacterium]
MNRTATLSNLDLSYLKGQDFAVLGLGVSGMSAAAALQGAGVHVRLWDDSVERRESAAARGLDPVDLNDADFAAIDALVLSPGIPHGYPHSHPIIDRARDAGCEILCDLELLTRAETNARYVGVTGTNGKSTTTKLIGHVLSQLGIANAIGGNIGAPGLSLPAMGKTGVYVLELSSYQLELLPLAVFDIAVLMNITPDHLDRHGGMHGYMTAKRRIFDGQISKNTAIVGIDDGLSKSIFDDLRTASDATIVSVSTRETCAGGIYLSNGWLIDDREDAAVPILELASLETLPGLHNAQNVAAAYAASSVIMDSALQADRDAIVAAIRSFPGLAHRQELVGYLKSVRFVNDSKATNAEAASHALAAYDNIIWIAGGIAKDGGIASLDALFNRVDHAFLIGEAADEFAGTLKGRVSTDISGDLETAVADATRLAGNGPATVLLSPACASFDQFPSFEARGDAFKAAVHAFDGFSLPNTGGSA